MVHSCILVFALCIDSFLASLAYGVERIHIPFRCAFLISMIGVGFLGIPLYAAEYLQQWIPAQFCTYISFAIFFLIGISSIFQGTIKQTLRKHQMKRVCFEYSGISFVLDVYLDETKADMDNSKQLSMKEAFYLAIAVSIDSFVSGFAFGISIHHPLYVIILCFVLCIIVIYLGSYIGEHSRKAIHLDLSWLSGIMFLILAFTRIL